MVDVHQLVGFDDPHLGCGVAEADMDEFASESDVAGVTDFADVGVGRIDRFDHPFGVGGAGHIGLDGGDAVAFRRGVVVDALVGALPVVVEPEPVQQLLEMLKGFGWTFVLEPFFDGAVEPFQLA